MKGVLLVEDHASFRHCLAYMLDQDPAFEVIAQSGSLAEARASMADKDGSVNVALVDLLLPDGNRVELIPELSGHNPGVPVVVLTVFFDPDSRERALAAGAREVLSKAASLEEIISTIKRVAEVEPPASSFALGLAAG